MTPAQAKQLLEQLFALPEYRVTPSGRQILFFLTPRELAKHLPCHKKKKSRLTS